MILNNENLTAHL